MGGLVLTNHTVGANCRFPVGLQAEETAFTFDRHVGSGEKVAVAEGNSGAVALGCGHDETGSTGGGRERGRAAVRQNRAMTLEELIDGVAGDVTSRDPL